MMERGTTANAAAQSLWKPLKPGIQRKTLCSTRVQSLTDYDLGLHEKLAAVLQIAAEFP